MLSWWDRHCRNDIPNAFPISCSNTLMNFIRFSGVLSSIARNQLPSELMWIPTASYRFSERKRVWVRLLYHPTFFIQKLGFFWNLCTPRLSEIIMSAFWCFVRKLNRCDSTRFHMPIGLTARLSNCLVNSET
jgi:hypothetical protein